jgi:hypothetical protein
MPLTADDARCPDCGRIGNPWHVRSFRFYCHVCLHARGHLHEGSFDEALDAVGAAQAEDAGKEP